MWGDKYRKFSKTFKITMKDIEAFSRVVGDYNPVHHDAEFAAKTRFKSPIAHGMISMAMFNFLMTPYTPVKSFSIKFLKPIYP
jgi:3-hydroxybutyryl-CoA dehydratase